VKVCTDREEASFGAHFFFYGTPHRNEIASRLDTLGRLLRVREVVELDHRIPRLDRFRTIE